MDFGPTILESDGDHESKNIGKEKYAQGHRPHFPLVIVPGLASSVLKATESTIPKWENKRVWISVGKLSRKLLKDQFVSTTHSVRATLLDKLHKNHEEEKGDKHRENSDDPQDEQHAVWVKHIALQQDGHSDPPGIKLRAPEGIDAIDYLSRSKPFKSHSTVFGTVISNLEDLGYNDTNMVAAPYDWRLSPQHLESRDGYFTELIKKIELLRKTNEKRVVIVAHSMGYKTIQYFLWWQHQRDSMWIEKNVETLVAIAAPILGAPRLLRSVITGFRNGLELFLSYDEMKHVCRTFGSVPMLFPSGSSYSCNVRDGDSHTFNKRSLKSVLELSGAQNTWRYHEEYYTKDPLWGALKGEITEDEPIEVLSGQNWETILTSCHKEYHQLPMNLRPPPVKHVMIYGTGTDTEISYNLRHRSSGKVYLDTKGDMLASSNGYRSKGGIIYETKDTRQRTYCYSPRAEQDLNMKTTAKHAVRGRVDDGPTFHSVTTEMLTSSHPNDQPTSDGLSHLQEFQYNRCGDGSVPYSSLNFFQRFIGLHEKDENVPEIEILEIPGRDHRLILMDHVLIGHLIDTVSKKVKDE
ncbi:hypothetical protein PROFUN_09803 [Planoprotostelium fungivorum]|uniref:Phospholipid:diacylglycerol acyltransferase n=1 Tax=Planoprotostelium fungivorum TaxID=1890364 RepID=A0A2P6NGP5_9EUKA|nr:hypothetical protein PROFUN_09803 [Planoprotostelium fungivorum]